MDCVEVVPRAGDRSHLAWRARDIAELRALVDDGRDDAVPALVDLLARQADELRSAGDREASDEAVAAALALAGERDDAATRIALAGAWYVRSGFDWGMRDRDALGDLERAAAILAGLPPEAFGPGDRDVHVKVCDRLGVLQDRLGDLAAADGALDRGLALYDQFRPELDRRYIGQLWLHKGTVLAALGRHREACDLFGCAIECYDFAGGHELDLGVLHERRGRSYRALGEPAAAIAAYEQADRTLRLLQPDPDLALQLARVLVALADLRREIGAAAGALAPQRRACELMRQLARRDRSLPLARERARARVTLAQLLALAGGAAAAATELEALIPELDEAVRSTGDEPLAATLQLAWTTLAGLDP